VIGFINKGNEILVTVTLNNTCVAVLCDRECTRGGFCNFMHLKPISRELRRKLYGRQKKYVPRFTFNKQKSDVPEPRGPTNLHFFIYLALNQTTSQGCGAVASDDVPLYSPQLSLILIAFHHCIPIEGWLG